MPVEVTRSDGTTDDLLGGVPTRAGRLRIIGLDDAVRLARVNGLSLPVLASGYPNPSSQLEWSPHTNLWDPSRSSRWLTKGLFIFTDESGKFYHAPAGLTCYRIGLQDSGPLNNIGLRTGSVTTFLDGPEAAARQVQDRVALGAGLNGTYTVSYSRTTRKFTIACTETFTMTAVASDNALTMLGFTSAPYSGASTYTADLPSIHTEERIIVPLDTVHSTSNIDKFWLWRYVALADIDGLQRLIQLPAGVTGGFGVEIIVGPDADVLDTLDPASLPAGYHSATLTDLDPQPDGPREGLRDHLILDFQFYLNKTELPTSKDADLFMRVRFGNTYSTDPALSIGAIIASTGYWPSKGVKTGHPWQSAPTAGHMVSPRGFRSPVNTPLGGRRARYTFDSSNFMTEKEWWWLWRTIGDPLDDSKSGGLRRPLFIRDPGIAPWEALTSLVPNISIGSSVDSGFERHGNYDTGFGYLTLDNIVRGDVGDRWEGNLDFVEEPRPE